MEFRQFLLCGLLLLFFSSMGLGHPEVCPEVFPMSSGIKIGSMESDGGGEDDCYVNVTIKVQIANLIQDHNGNWVLPSRYEDLYVTYNFLGLTETVQLTTFQPSGLSSPEPLFYWLKMLLINMEDFCLNDDPDNYPWPSFSLHTEDGSYYPIHDYSTPGYAFSCQVFDLTFCDCPENCTNPPANPPNPHWSGDVFIPACEDCWAGEDPIPSGDDREISKGEESSSRIAEDDIELSPNPFDTDFLLQIDLDEKSELDINIMDLNGKTVNQLTHNADKGIFRERYSTETWPSGIYFVRVRVNGTQQTYKIIKTE